MATAFDGGTVSSDGGALLLAHTDQAIGLIDRLAKCFRDHRLAQRVERPVRTRIGQRVPGIVVGYSDLNASRCAAQGPVVECSDRQAPTQAP